LNTPELPSSRKTTVIIGAGGRLGKDLQQTFRNDNIIAFSREDLDLRNPLHIEHKLLNIKFDRVLLSASITAVDYCEENETEAFQVNAEAPRLIAEIAAQKRAAMSYISTDFVFDGLADSPLNESASTFPINIYGASKLKGEEAVLRASPVNLVARVSWLFGHSRPAFPEWIINKALTEKSLFLPSDKIATPTSSEDVARFLKILLDDTESEKARGLFHLCNSGECTWQEWGQSCLEVARRAGLPLATDVIKENRLEDIEFFKAQRPKYSTLDNTKFMEVTGVKPATWTKALSTHLQKSCAQTLPCAVA
jgi:dTDP-4-dehydrorhamnose reductase